MQTEGRKSQKYVLLQRGCKYALYSCSKSLIIRDVYLKGKSDITMLKAWSPEEHMQKNAHYKKKKDNKKKKRRKKNRKTDEGEDEYKVRKIKTKKSSESKRAAQDVHDREEEVAIAITAAAEGGASSDSSDCSSDEDDSDSESGTDSSADSGSDSDADSTAGEDQDGRHQLCQQENERPTPSTTHNAPSPSSSSSSSLAPSPIRKNRQKRRRHSQPLPSSLPAPAPGESQKMERGRKRRKKGRKYKRRKRRHSHDDDSGADAGSGDGDRRHRDAHYYRSSQQAPPRLSLGSISNNRMQRAHSEPFSQNPYGSFQRLVSPKIRVPDAQAEEWICSSSSSSSSLYPYKPYTSASSLTSTSSAILSTDKLGVDTPSSNQTTTTTITTTITNSCSPSSPFLPPSHGSSAASRAHVLNSHDSAHPNTKQEASSSMPVLQGFELPIDDAAKLASPFGLTQTLAISHTTLALRKASDRINNSNSNSNSTNNSKNTSTATSSRYSDNGASSRQTGLDGRGGTPAPLSATALVNGGPALSTHTAGSGGGLLGYVPCISLHPNLMDECSPMTLPAKKSLWDYNLTPINKTLAARIDTFATSTQAKPDTSNGANHTGNSRGDDKGASNASGPGTGYLASATFQQTKTTTTTTTTTIDFEFVQPTPNIGSLF